LARRKGIIDAILKNRQWTMVRLELPRDLSCAELRPFLREFAKGRRVAAELHLRLKQHLDDRCAREIVDALKSAAKLTNLNDWDLRIVCLNFFWNEQNMLLDIVDKTLNKKDQYESLRFYFAG
jgi:hypothetical protein